MKVFHLSERISKQSCLIKVWMQAIPWKFWKQPRNLVKVLNKGDFLEDF